MPLPIEKKAKKHQKSEIFFCYNLLKLIGPAKVHTDSESSLHPFHRSHSHDFDRNGSIQALAT